MSVRSRIRRHWVSADTMAADNILPKPLFYIGGIPLWITVTVIGTYRGVRYDWLDR